MPTLNVRHAEPVRTDSIEQEDAAVLRIPLALPVAPAPAANILVKYAAQRLILNVRHA